MHKLVTVVWSTTVLIDLPAGVGLDQLDEMTGPNAERAGSIIRDAWDHVEKGEGVITDVEDADV